MTDTTIRFATPELTVAAPRASRRWLALSRLFRSGRRPRALRGQVTLADPRVLADMGVERHASHLDRWLDRYVQASGR
jgi:hypothetical protein